MSNSNLSGNIFKSLPFVFAFMSVAILVVLISIVISSSGFLNDEEKNILERGSHYAFFLPVSDQSFYAELEKGAIDAGEEFNSYISFYTLNKNPKDLDMVPYLGIDGIALYPIGNSDEIKKQIIGLERYGIPVIQIENEVLRDKSTYYIGTNNFESGKAIAEIAETTGKDLLNIELIYTEKNPGLLSNRVIVEMGLKVTLGDKVNKLNYQVTSLNPLDAERIVYEIVKNSPETDLIVLTDPNDTLVAVQAVIDSNMVGEIQIISFGESDELKEYMDKGIIIGSIVRNPYEIGYNAVKALREIDTSGYTSSFLDTGIRKIW